MKLVKALVVATGAALVVAGAASAHVTLNPEKAPADSFTRFALRVPNEEDVPTVKVSVQLPEGLDEASFQPNPGWKRTQSGRVVTWSGGEIGVGEFDEFGLSTHLPNAPGTTLIFPATQTYANGKVVHWIGPLTADEPAPHVALEAAEGQSTTTTTTTSATTDDSEDSSDAALWVAIAALILGAAAFGFAFIRTRRA